MEKEETFEEFGQCIDRLNNLSESLKMPIPDSIHRSAMLDILPELRDQLKEIYLTLGGEDVWSI